jgi:Putative collagen-binding domain of a collagenase
MKTKRILHSLFSIFFFTSIVFGMAGPLRIPTSNTRYFTDDSGKAVYLAGMHTWNNLVDIGPSDPPAPFDYQRYLDLLEKYHHNFFRLWAWQHFISTWDSTHFITPSPWVRTGPSSALDGKPKFDLTALNQEYFDRLRTRVKAAGDRGIYTSIMLFEGWGLQFNPDPWKGYPFNVSNNKNNINGDPNGNGKGIEINMWEPPVGVWEIQKAYLRKVIDTVNDLDNVLYEVVNEAGPYSTMWQNQVINFVKCYEAEKPKQHPIGMTFQYKGGNNSDLFNSQADWISPNPAGGYDENPPAANGSKVIINDTDHLWGIGGSRTWVWKSFCRGLNVLFMDPYFDVKEGGGIYTGGNIVKKTFTPEDLQEIRLALGYTRRYAEKMNLIAMTPQNELSSTGYCLANTSPEQAEYLVYSPKGGEMSVDVSAAKKILTVEWFEPVKGKTTTGGTVAGGAPHSFTPPFEGEAVLYLVCSGR